jgi:hypothetical protein
MVGGREVEFLHKIRVFHDFFSQQRGEVETQRSVGVSSPDRRWLAYVSNDTGREELYVQSFPEPAHKRQISTDGVSAHGWSNDDRHLVFVSGDKTLWRADVEPGNALTVIAPARIGAFPTNVVAADMMPDGQRFLALAPDRNGTGSMTIVWNWCAAFEKKR